MSQPPNPYGEQDPYYYRDSPYSDARQDDSPYPLRPRYDVPPTPYSQQHAADPWSADYQQAYRDEVSQPRPVAPSSNPWKRLTTGPLFSSRSWPDIYANSLSPLQAMLPPLARLLPRWLLAVSTIGSMAILDRKSVV